MDERDPVPMYSAAEGGSLADDLRRIAEASNNPSQLRRRQTHNSVPPAPTATIPDIDSGDPDTDLLIQRLLREDAEEQRGPSQPAAEPVNPPDIIKTFFECIKNENSELISALIDGGFVTPGTKNRDGVTPLVAAVKAGHVRVVQQLVDYGANVDDLSAEVDSDAEMSWVYRNGRIVPDGHYHLQRTPLMVAAGNGHMPLVKLFMEVYHARDDIVPSDGMTALRLAAQNGHRDIVNYLPARRIGGLQRWKFRNRASILRSKRLLLNIYGFFKVALYDVPRFFIWTLPKHSIVLPIRNSSRYLWNHKKEIAKKIKNGVVATGKGIKNGVIATGKGIAKLSKRAAAGTVKGIKAIPSVTLRLIKAIWKLLTVQLPKAIVQSVNATINFIKAVAKWVKKTTVATAKATKKIVVWVVKQLWKTLTVRIPNAIVIIVKSIWTAIKYTATKTGDFVVRIASAIHTLLTKMVNWMSGITWKDVMNGFLDVFKWIFVELPTMVWHGIESTGNLIKKVLKAMFGFFGEVFYYLGLGILFVVAYIPQQLFHLVMELFGAIGRGLHEVAVWINPKTI